MQVKQAVAGYGGADKRQVMLMTQRLLNMKQVPRPDDAADALGPGHLPRPCRHQPPEHRTGL